MGNRASKSKQPTKPDLRILILGSAGVGKSSTGNSILEEDVFQIVYGMTHVTDKCYVGKSKKQDREIQVVDTPSKFESEETLFKEIRQGMNAISPGPHVVLYLIRYDQRFTEELYREYHKLISAFTDKIKQFMIVVFTGDIPPGSQDDIDNQKLRNEFLSKILDDVSDRYIFLDNKKQKKNQRVQELLNKADELYLKNKNAYFYIDEIAKAEAKKKKKVKGTSLEAAEADLNEEIFENENDLVTNVVLAMNILRRIILPLCELYKTINACLKRNQI